ncbi:MAG: leucyl-tRNA synthetase [Parcubacteria group bacterium Gr01-1014_18]|nr:MAG: leucyl-tRNA synthetase [Parcubacteria group bacterium Greene0416_36]TSC81021.1 MAG: leucyl-tRNA synthetase [Parcubacteria group bacterium Gr01-1014_18]TSC98943.1 MAG: leucyl-tRNA synthetase [Parcubacteria group bacterium Greene1014_20]TSD06765.1 MAG: leucyl-tRNA synthetase [Parcubacteria group bacterium Greene0714_2]
MKYDHGLIDAKWQEKWAKEGAYKTSKELKGPKYYILDMFPYPSGTGLHVGHPKGYIATDIVARFAKMRGASVLHPMGWDAFGLPAENFAIKNKIHPRAAVEANIVTYKRQLESIGFSYDWDHEVNTTDPDYYRWTQWIFVQLWKKGLAYESREPINWCPSCKTGLANEDLEGGKCERCGSDVEKKPMRQWVLKITDYADRLLEDLKLLDWPESIKESQRNWIGRSEGAEIQFKIKNDELRMTNDRITVFTTRPDTIFGATYVVLAPENEIVSELLKQKGSIKNESLVFEYVNAAKKMSEIDRSDAKKEKTGVNLEGVFVINPANGKKISVWIADYVLPDYGTGAVMGVPAHDKRDWDFARKYKLSIVRVISSNENKSDFDNWHDDYLNSGKLIQSGSFDGQDSLSSKKAITEFVGGKWVIKYKLRDWVFSRQRYWGEPIPIVHCQSCGAVAVPEAELPVKLPDVDHYEPTGTGESPLAAIESWVNTSCPQCGGPGKRETNTMPQWAGSSWYYLRFIDPRNTEALVDPAKEKYWMKVDLYVGGAEHATRHLIYARFWHKFLHDLGAVSTIEPFLKLWSVGLIMGEDGRKMSKRFGNVVNPDDVIAEYGADVFRMYEMFMGPFSDSISWSTEKIKGVARFLDKVYDLKDHLADSESPDVTRLLAKTIAKVTDDMDTFSFNTSVSAMMIFINEAREKGISRSSFAKFVQILCPFAPHLSEELWSLLGHEDLVVLSSWPTFDPSMIQNETGTWVIQINSKVRAQIIAPIDTPLEEMLEMAKKDPKIMALLESKEIKKTIFVRGKLVNFVV